MLLVVTWTMLWTYIIMRLVRRFFRELSDDEVLAGLDKTNHGMLAYDDEEVRFLLA